MDNQVQKPAREQYEKVPDFLSTYSNSARMTIGLWDFRFTFGEVEQATSDMVKVSEKVSVIMSPQHAKMFLQIFEQNFRKYEERFGEIKLPPGILVEQGEQDSTPKAEP